MVMRGGAALSIKSVTVNCPIKFVGVGEKLDQLERFHPERMVSRILWMGMLSFIERVEKAIDEEKAQELERKFWNSRLLFRTFVTSCSSFPQHGSSDQLLEMIPGTIRKP